MGLDMYLQGERYRGYQRDEEPSTHETAYMGCKLQYSKYEIEYWRKHNQLHGYIVKEFASEAEDNCQPIYLSREDIEQIIEYLGSVQEFPATPGFFFGSDNNEYSPEQRKFDVDAFRKALDFLDAQDEASNMVETMNYNEESIMIREYNHSVEYQASW